ncbi:MAG TPA: lysophospholipid acyltransferase family protein [Spirillospora sp.]|nr:lysophospholipid acyltransferase family protein [Spirillospora sp.]
MADTYAIRYPRRIVVRAILVLIGRVLIRLLARPHVTGLENLPRKGPVILVGNHVAMIEVVLMALYAPWQVEFIGTGDIPVDPRFAWLVKLWGIIPVNRGSTDRREMAVPLDVLRQGGVVGIFPEGGIWSTSLKRARTGVAWLSFHANAPVLPIGFGGMRGALQAVFALKRPRLTMNVGQLMPPVSGRMDGKSRKESLEAAANAIMAEVTALIPEEEKRSWNRITDERFDFEFIVHTANGSDGIPKPVIHRDGLGRFFHVPVILDVMARNMHLPVQPLQRLDSDPRVIADAAGVALSFFDSHPHFLSYRFGYEQAAEIYAGVVELRELARAAAAEGQAITLRPVRQYRSTETGEQVIETTPGAMHEM